MRANSTVQSLHIERNHPLSRASDERLLLRYRDHGDPEAFSELVHRYERELNNYLRRYVGDASVAEDVFQAAFLQVHLKAQLFQKGRVFRPWLYTIATHQAIDSMRKARRHRAVSLNAPQAASADEGALINSLVSTTPGPVEQLEGKERRAWTRRAVKELPDHLRAALILTSYRGLKYRKVAEILRIPEGTVKTRVHTAKAILNAAWRRVAC